MITSKSISVEVLRDSKPKAGLWNKDGFNYFLLNSGDFYALRVRNDSSDDGVVDITLNGSDSARFLIDAKSEQTFETLETYGPRFRFQREDSFQAWRQGFEVGDEKNGLVEIVFIPKLRRLSSPSRSLRYLPQISSPSVQLGAPASILPQAVPVAPLSPLYSVPKIASALPQISSSPLSAMAESLPQESGVTTFEGRSDDRYRSVRTPPLDHGRKVEIFFRLMVDPDYKPSYRGGQFSSPYPPRLD